MRNVLTVNITGQRYLLHLYNQLYQRKVITDVRIRAISTHIYTFRVITHVRTHTMTTHVYARICTHTHAPSVIYVINLEKLDSMNAFKLVNHSHIYKLLSLVETAVVT